LTDLSTDQSSSARILALGFAVLLGSYLLVTSTVSLSDTFWLYDVKRFLQICLLPMIFATVLFNRTLRGGFLAQYENIPPWMRAALALLIGLGVAGVNGRHWRLEFWHEFQSGHRFAAFFLGTVLQPDTKLDHAGGRCLAVGFSRQSLVQGSVRDGSVPWLVCHGCDGWQG
jgi:hypothetical protein